MRSIVKEIQELTSYEAVVIPKKQSEACRWKTARKPKNGSVVIPTQDLLDIMEFALDNTYIKNRKGEILQQTKGIPMGDPHSPGMAIITCAWMEKEWMKSIANGDKQYFTIKRFMDDILCVYSKNPQWKHEDFVRDFCRSEVYAKPLRLEDGKENTFLETRFKITATNKIDFWLKNENEIETKIWRYSHFHSHGSFVQKRATLTACLKKTEAMASNKYVFFNSAVNKIREFQNLAYPNTILKGACTFLAATTGNGAWMDVKRHIR